MKRGVYYLLKIVAIISRVFKNRNLYMFILKKAHEVNGVVFLGKPRYIHQNVVLDTSANLVLGDNIVISTGVLLLTHDYSYTTGLISISEKPAKDIKLIMPITIGDNCFIGANSTILPGTRIGSNVIIGAGSVVRGNVPNYSIVSGNPASIIKDIRAWTMNKKLSVKYENLIIDKK